MSLLKKSTPYALTADFQGLLKPQAEGAVTVETLKKVAFDLGVLEETPISFSLDQETEPKQLIDFLAYLKDAKKIQLLAMEKNESELQKYLLVLERNMIGLSYRLEEENGGQSPSCTLDMPLLLKLQERAIEWKLSQKIFWDKALSEKDCLQLITACRYPPFSQLLLNDEALQKEFFAWTIRDGNPVVPFIEFPTLIQKLIFHRVNGRIGRTGGNALKIVKDSKGKKILTLLFEGIDKSILNWNETVTFRGGLTLRIDEIFTIVKNKNFKVGDVEFLEGGIYNWNSHWCGWWDPKSKKYQLIDVEETNWWWKLPLFERLTLSQAKERYGEELNGSNWVIIAKASRRDTTLDYVNTHAYLELVIPLIEEKMYYIFPFGKFAREYPANFWQLVRMFGLVNPGTIAYPDENVYLTHRQHIGYTFPLSQEQGLFCMDLIKRDILRARSGNIVFQTEADNCAKWIEEILEEIFGKENIPNLFRIPLIESEPKGFTGKLFSVIKLLPKSFHIPLLTFFHYPFLPWKGRWVIDKTGNKEWRSLTTSTFWKDTYLHVPSYLHKQGELEDPTKSKSIYQSGQEKIITHW